MERLNSGRKDPNDARILRLKESIMAHVIINADDFGISDGVCKSIIELLEAGAITSTSIMCAADGAVERISSWNARSLLGVAGVHLQLTSGVPISPASEVRTLVDEGTGRFIDPRDGPLPDLDQVECEWRRQIEVAMNALGGVPSHLDSHHGMHRIPELFEVYARLAMELGIPIRSAKGEIAKRMHSLGIRGTVALVRDWTGKSLGPESLPRMLNQVIKAQPEEDVVEIISHPGYSDDYLSSISSLALARENDHRGLLELHRVGWPQNEGHILVSFRYLSNTPQDGGRREWQLPTP
jgi:predicted glycoside hydrolase/deacetylase ChbG (UPF0249 family)